MKGENFEKKKYQKTWENAYLAFNNTRVSKALGRQWTLGNILEYSWSGQFFVQMKLSKFVDLYSKQLGNHFKDNEKIPGNLLENLKNHGKVIEFYQSGKMGTLLLLVLILWYITNLT